MNKELKEKLILILIAIEFIISCVLMGIYIYLPRDDAYKGLFNTLTIMMFFITLITIYVFNMTDKVKKVVKKVAEVVFNLTVGVIFRVFDALLNMTTANRTGSLKVITGYEDKVFSVREQKKKRRANYKSYRKMDNREKVRFLYYKAVTKAVRKGFGFREADTPFEVNERLIERKYYKNQETQLGEIYSVGRYDSQCEITDEMVEVMKKSC